MGILDGYLLEGTHSKPSKKSPHVWGKFPTKKVYQPTNKKQADTFFPSNKKPPRSLRILKMDATIKSPKQIIRIPPQKSKHGTCQQAFPKPSIFIEKNNNLIVSGNVTSSKCSPIGSMGLVGLYLHLPNKVKPRGCHIPVLEDVSPWLSSGGAARRCKARCFPNARGRRKSPTRY